MAERSPLADVLADLEAESRALDDRVAGLPASAWATPTPAEGWTIAHQIGHLAWTDEMALLSIDDPARLRALGRVAASDPTGQVDRAAAERAALDPVELMAGWRAGRARLSQRLASADGRKLEWFGPPMSAASMATARLMETWAHGLDVADALGQPVAATGRLRHIARLAVRTRDFAFIVNDRPVPAEEFRIELAAPDGTLWSYGPEDATQSVTGSAEELCLLAAQRRNRRDLNLRAVGPQAEEWLTIMQMFAGPPGTGR